MSTELPKNKSEENLLELEDLYSASEKAREKEGGKQKESIPRKKLFLSVEGLMIDLLPRKLTLDGPNSRTEIIQPVKQKDLNTGLFYFGCTRDEFFNFEKGGPIADQLKFFGAKGLTTFKTIENAVDKAEKEGRVFWPEKRGQKTGHSFQGLNQLLTQNNISSSKIKYQPHQNGKADFEDVVKDQIAELGLSLDVMG